MKRDIFITENSVQSNALGAAIARQLLSRDVVVLTGEMGNGKSEIARGIARGLSIEGPIPSPSFTILNDYEEGRLPLHHFDWYRIEDEEELFESGLDEVVGSPGITVIEWHEKAADIIPKDKLEIIIKKLQENGREIEIISHGEFRRLDMEKLRSDYMEEQNRADTCL